MTRAKKMERLNKILTAMDALLNKDTSIKLGLFVDPVKTSKLLQTNTGTLIKDSVMPVMTSIH